MTATLTFLGTGDSKGVPRYWCACPVCTEARTSGLNRRTRTAHLLRGAGLSGAVQVALLDVGTDLHAQLARLHLDGLPGPTLPDAVFISHAHNDHLLGLADILDHIGYGGYSLPIYAPADVIPQIADRFGYAFRGAAPVQAMPAAGVEVAGFTVRLFRVPHGANGYSHAYKLTRPAAAYRGWSGVLMTDAIDVPGGVADAELRGLDFLALGTSFADESGVNLPTGRSVYDVREARALPWAQSARRVYLTHLSHGVDVRATTLPDGWAFAHDGLTVDLLGTRDER